MKEDCISTENFYFAILEIIFHGLHGVLITVASLAVLVNAFLLLIIAIGIYSKRVPAKRLLFVANRSVVDAIAAGVSLIYLYKVEVQCDKFELECEAVTFVPDALMQMIITFNYWMLAGSYFGIGMLTFYAVRTPLKYKLALDVWRVARFIAMGWIVMIGLLFMINFWTEQQAMFDSNGVMYMMKNKYYEQLSEWMVSLCEKVIDKSMLSTGMLSLILPVFSYVTTLLSYGFVALVLFRRRNDRRNVSSKQRDHTAIWRLGVHLGVFTFSFCLMALAYAATFPMADSCLNWSSELIDKHNRYLQTHAARTSANANPLVKRASMPIEEEECQLQHIYAFTRYVTLTALAGTGWFARMCIDPMIDLLLDTHIRRLIFTTRTLERTSTTLLLENRLSCEAPSTARTQ